MGQKIFTGIKPTSNQIHLGNYFGAVKPLFDFAKKNSDAEVFFMVATMHALTTLHDSELLKGNVLGITKLYLSMMRQYGFDDDAFCIFNQPDVAGHAELAWVFECITHMGFMERMHAYKDAAAKGKSGQVSVGTFCYPILQAVDILIYDTNFVPVGKDQKQHVEYSRDIAEKFNSLFGETFELPKCLIHPSVATVPGIDGRKMSKSYNNFIGLMDDEDVIKKKIARIPTSPIPIESPKDPDEDAVYQIFRLFLDKDEDALLRKRYIDGGLSYKDVKMELSEKVIAFIRPIQQEYKSIEDSYVIDLLKKNALKTNQIANQKVQEVYKKIGFSL